MISENQYHIMVLEVDETELNTGRWTKVIPNTSEMFHVWADNNAQAELIAVKMYQNMYPKAQMIVFMNYGTGSIS